MPEQVIFQCGAQFGVAQITPGARRQLKTSLKSSVSSVAMTASAASGVPIVLPQNQRKEHRP
jgi:hypothetical protein